MLQNSEAANLGANVTELTEMETEVLIRLTKGQDSEEIENSCSLSRSTILRITKNIKTKLGLSSLTDFIKYAVRNGFIAPDFEVVKAELTNKQKEVAKLMKQGYPDTQIAKALNISLRAVIDRKVNVKAKRGKQRISDKYLDFFLAYVNDQPNKEIAKAFQVKDSHVRRAVFLTKKQLGLKTKADCIKFALCKGLIPLD